MEVGRRLYGKLAVQNVWHSLNPYSDGSWSPTTIERMLNKNHMSLNPYSDGSWSPTASELLDKLVNVKVSILILMEVGRRHLSKSHFEIQGVVSILILMEVGRRLTQKVPKN